MAKIQEGCHPSDFPGRRYDNAYLPLTLKVEGLYVQYASRGSIEKLS